MTMNNDPITKARELFYEKYFGEPKLVLHSVVSVTPHIDVFVYGPRQGRDYYTLVTSGMSNFSEESTDNEQQARTELILYIEDVDIVQYSSENPWEVQHLLNLASFPSKTGFQFDPFLTLPNGNPPQPFVEGSELTHTIFFPPMYEEKTLFDGVELPNGDIILFLMVDFISTAENQLLESEGPEGIINLLMEKNHSPLCDFDRKSYV